MEKKQIEVPEAVMDYLEALWYQAEGYKNLVRFLSCQPDVNPEALQGMTATYQQFFSEYNLALNQACRDHARQEVEDGCNVFPNFILGVLVAVKGGEACAAVSLR